MGKCLQGELLISCMYVCVCNFQKEQLRICNIENVYDTENQNGPICANSEILKDIFCILFMSHPYRSISWLNLIKSS